MRRAFLLLLLIVQAFVPCGTTTPSADFCCTVRMDYSTLSPGSGTCSRSPAISLTAFNAQPPNLQPVPLMDMDFAVSCQLVRHRMPRIRFLSIGSRLCSTLPSDPASRRRPCASLSLLLHQDVKGTYTPKLSNMHGVQSKALPIFQEGWTKRFVREEELGQYSEQSRVELAWNGRSEPNLAKQGVAWI
jgi:hypothetical protein